MRAHSEAWSVDLTSNFSSAITSLAFAFRFCISTSILHKHRRLESLLNEHRSLYTRLHQSHLWTLVREQCVQVDALFKSYLSNPAFIWQTTDTMEQFLQDLSASIQLLSSQTHTLSTITANLRNSLMSYAPALKKRINLPITQPLAPVSEFLASSRSWSNDQLPDSIVVHILNDILSQESELGDTPKYFIPKFAEVIQYHEYLSFGSMVLADTDLCNNNTDGDGLNQQISLFINTCNQIEERIYLFKRSIESQLDSYCKEVELLRASSELSDELCWHCLMTYLLPCTNWLLCGCFICIFSLHLKPHPTPRCNDAHWRQVIYKSRLRVTFRDPQAITDLLSLLSYIRPSISNP